MTGRNSAISSVSPPNFPQNPDQTLDIRQLENGLERHGARSRPTTPPLASLARLDAFTRALRHGIPRTISARMETENTRQYLGGVWLMTQSVANPSPWGFSLLTGKRTGNFSILGPVPCAGAKKVSYNSAGYDEFPKWRNREINHWIRELFSREQGKNRGRPKPRKRPFSAHLFAEPRMRFVLTGNLRRRYT